MPSALYYWRNSALYRTERKSHYQNNRKETLEVNRQYRLNNHVSVLAHIKEWQRKNKMKKTAYAVATRRKKMSGFTKEMFASSLVKQNGLCAICGVAFQSGTLSAACADHDHATNTPRAILCKRCNLLLGNAKDDPDILMKAIAYLNQWQTA